jgi:hypothetical protein
MTQALNLALLANNVNASGQLLATAISGAVPNATNATNAVNATNATNLVGGSMSCSSGAVTSGAPTIWFYDTDQADFAVHVNSNIWYVLNQGGAGVIYTDQSGNFTAAGNSSAGGGMNAGGNINAGGSVTASSDERFKTDITTIANALDVVKSMRGVAFVKDGKADIGVIAQEVQKILPQVVHEDKDGYLSVAYGNIVGVLIEAVKDLSKQIEEIKGAK